MPLHPYFSLGRWEASRSACMLQITTRIAGQNPIRGVLFLKRAEGMIVRARSALWACGPGQPPSTPRGTPVFPSPHFFLTPISNFISFSCLYFHCFPLPSPSTSIALPRLPPPTLSPPCPSSQSPSASLPLTPARIHGTGPLP